LPDGNLDYLGRGDDQVKVLGHRVELGEIESAFRAHPGIDGAAVLATQGASGVALIAAIAITGAGPTDEELHTHLRSSLPPPMIPHRILRFESLPVTGNGKLDRAAVLAAATVPASDRNAISAEAALANKFREALGLAEIDHDADFFELGGDSMATVAIVTWAAEQFGIPLEISALFEYPTVRAMANRVLELMRADASSAS
jgi:acyl carrier protein